MAIYAVFESTNMRATHYAKRIFDCVCDKDVENGMFGYMDGLVDGHTHMYNFVAGTKEGKQIVVVNQPAWTEDECSRTNQRRDKFYIPAGTPFRVFCVDMDDEFAITKEACTKDTMDAIEVGKFLTIDATGKLKVADASTDGAVMEAEVMRKRKQGDTIVTGVRTYGYSNMMYTAKINVLA